MKLCEKTMITVNESFRCERAQTYNVLEARFVSSCFNCPSRANPHLSLLLASSGVIVNTLLSVNPGPMGHPSLQQRPPPHKTHSKHHSHTPYWVGDARHSWLALVMFYGTICEIPPHESASLPHDPMPVPPQLNSLRYILILPSHLLLSS